MSDVKMSDVFKLPVIIGNDGVLRQKDGKLIDFTKQERESTVISINEHDQLIAKVTEQAAEIERLRGMLTEVSNKSISCANELVSYINAVNEGLEKCIIATDTQPPEYHDKQTAYEAAYLATKALKYLSECAK